MALFAPNNLIFFVINQDKINDKLNEEFVNGYGI
jgi:hypothetical protein